MNNQYSTTIYIDLHCIKYDNQFRDYLNCMGGCTQVIHKYYVILYKALGIYRFWCLQGGGVPGTNAPQILRNGCIRHIQVGKCRDIIFLFKQWLFRLNYFLKDIANKRFFQDLAFLLVLQNILWFVVDKLVQT